MLEVIEVARRVTGRNLEVVVEEKQKGDMRDTYADTSLARRDLGYQPRTRLEEGLRKEWDWIRDQPSSILKTRD
jgi:UDP-glucose 4-epimerase